MNDKRKQVLHQIAQFEMQETARNSKDAKEVIGTMKIFFQAFMTTAQSREMQYPWVSWPSDWTEDMIRKVYLNTFSTVDVSNKRLFHFSGQQGKKAKQNQPTIRHSIRNWWRQYNGFIPFPLDENHVWYPKFRAWFWTYHFEYIAYNKFNENDLLNELATIATKVKSDNAKQFKYFTLQLKNAISSTKEAPVAVDDVAASDDEDVKEPPNKKQRTNK